MNNNAQEDYETPELNCEQEMQDWLKDIIQVATWDLGLTNSSVITFEEGHVMTNNKGLILILPNGRKFQLTVVQAN